MNLKTLREYAGDEVAQDAVDSLAEDVAVAIRQRDKALRQVEEFASLIATGSFPLLPQALGRFSLIPGATAALERIDTIWRESMAKIPQYS